MSDWGPNTSPSMSTGVSQSSGMARHVAEQMVQNYKMTPATLYSKLDPRWMPKKFLLHASLKIAQCIAKPDGRLIISWPPRHGKSRLATIASPIWTLENFPERNIILSTYGADLSTDFGREVRDIFRANEALLDERIRKDVKSVGRFMTTKGGGMLSVGLGGAITGKGADVFLIDDYIKTMEEAMSDSKRDSDWEWFTGTAYHRLEPGGSMIIIATRWHADDLIGRILKNFGTTEEGGMWDHIKFKAFAEEDDPLGRKLGEPLFPERYDEERLSDRRRVLGSLFFNALYQQEPEDEGSKLTDKSWIEVVGAEQIPLNDPNVVFRRIWDFGGGKNKEADPTVGMHICGHKITRQIWILDVYRKRASPEATETAVALRGISDGTATEVVIEQEPGASGKQLVAHYANNVLPRHTVRGSLATTSKVVRAQPFLAAAEAGKVKLLRAPWNSDFLDEFDAFPNGDHDDQVDTSAIGYNDIFNTKPSSPVWGREKLSQEERDTVGVRIYPEYVDKRAQGEVTTGLVWGRRRGKGVQPQGRMMGADYGDV